MKAVFEIEETVSLWEPPFSKNTDKRLLSVGEGPFEVIDGVEGKEYAFNLHKIDRENKRVLVEFNKFFGLKTQETPKDCCIWIAKNSPVSFSLPCGNQNLTKKLTLIDFTED